MPRSEDHSSLPAVAKPFRAVGARLLDWIDRTGMVAIFFAKAFVRIFTTVKQVPRIIKQVEFIGAKSAALILLIGLFTGMVLGLQGYYTLVKFGSEGLLGSAVALSIIRELGPVLSALMITGRAGSSMSAELGVMRITQQIDALDVMDIDPIRFLVSPKIAGAIISFPLLTALFDTIGIFGGYISGVLLLDVNGGAYLHRIESSVSWTDVWGGFAKSLTFAVIVSVICCFEGYYTHLREDVIGAEGVSHSTTTAVVKSSIFILIADYILTSFFM
jgi:phospholipid/cholesterol/gamma-HCH transport system permease protein